MFGNKPTVFFGSFWALFRLKTQFGETRGIFCADFYFTHKLSGNMQIMIVAHWKCTHSLLVFFFVVFMARFCTKKYHLEGFTSFWYYSAISSHNDNDTVSKIKSKWVTQLKKWVFCLLCYVVQNFNFCPKIKTLFSHIKLLLELGSNFWKIKKFRE